MGGRCSSCRCCCCHSEDASKVVSSQCRSEGGRDNPLPFTPKKEEAPQIRKPSDLPSPRNVYIAQYNYDSREELYMSFESEERLNVSDKSDPNWWFATSMDGSRKGYVRSTFLVQADPLEEEEWYCKDLDQARSESVLLFLSNEGNFAHGAFLIRPSQSLDGELVLSVRVEDQIRHFRILKSRDGMSYWLKRSKNDFPSVRALVQHHSQNADGLPVNLRRPIKQVEVVPLKFIAAQAWEIDRRDIAKEERIGDGNFGEVFKGKWLDKTVVAIKQVKRGKTDPNFLAEAERMKKFVHPNLISLYGVCTKVMPYWIITEFMANGDLLKYLKKSKDRLSTIQLFNFAYQVATGMAYLEMHDCVHRDLAARNVLVGNNGEVKVADFGLTASTNESMEDVEMVPTRWTAPEALSNYRIWTTKSDVWSYGVVLWELFSFGDVPYKEMRFNSEVERYVSSGNRLSCPKECPTTFYDVMVLCWKKEPESRPTFKSLKNNFEDYETFNINNGYVEQL